MKWLGWWACSRNGCFSKRTAYSHISTFTSKFFRSRTPLDSLGFPMDMEENDAFVEFTEERVELLNN